MTEYTPPAKGDALNGHVVRHLKVLTWGSFIFGVVWIILTVALDFLDTATPVGRQLRYQFGKCGASIIGVTISLWLTLLVEIIMNASILGRLAHDPKALAGYVGVLVAVAGYIYVNV